MKELYKNYKSRIIFTLLYWVTLILLNYFFLVVINLRYFGVVFYLLLYVFILSILSIVKSKELKAEKKAGNYSVRFVGKGKHTKRVLLMLGFVFIITIVVYGFVSSRMFNASSYQKLITVNESGEFKDDFELVDINKLPIVDHQYAMRLGDKVMGEKFTNDDGIELNYGSEYEVRTFYDIYYNGKPYMIAPLSYRGLFKWMNNKEGTPGYVLVDKYTGERELITDLNGNNLNMAYMPSSYFSKDLHRYLYRNGYRHEKLNNYIFEVDDQGNPFWVVIETNYTININGGKDVKRVIIVDAVTGEINDYLPKEAPDWVDNIYPKELVIEQLNDWGSLKNGWFNSVFAQRGVNETTNGSRRIYENNKLYHYTGFTSAGGDESSTGFVYVETRTKKARLYSIVGATEDAAMKSAEGQVRNFEGYNATFPVSLNVNNQPTFFITIKDDNGIIKKYTFVNIRDYTKVGVGDQIETAYNSYLNALGVKDQITDDEDLQNLTGVVERINWNIIEGQTVYYIKLEDKETIYTVKSHLSDELPLTQSGDSLTLKVTGNIIKVFDNDTI